MDPVQALREIAFLLERDQAESYRVKAFRTAARTLDSLDIDEVRRRARTGTLADLAGVGPKTAAIATEALQGATPRYLIELRTRRGPEESLDAEGGALLAAQRGDCHSHSDWSDGGSPPIEMAHACVALGHEWAVLTDHSPRLTVARGLSRERLERQLDLVAEVNAEVAPFRYLTGIEVDIHEDGSLDQDDDLLDRLDIVVASVHSKLRMEKRPMTERMVTAIANPRVDILGHCTGRLVTERKPRPESEFDVDIALEACRRFDVALEVNSRPERLDPPRRILRQAVEAGLLLAIDTDAHAPGQLAWQAYGVARAQECGAASDQIVTTWSAERLLTWAGRKRATTTIG